MEWIPAGVATAVAVLMTVLWLRARADAQEAWGLVGLIGEKLATQEWERLLLRSAVWVGGGDEDEGEAPGRLDVRA